MRLVIERGELLRALGHVTSVVERRTTIPILSNVLLRARDAKLEFKATDLEREVIEGVPGDISAPGAVTVLPCRAGNARETPARARGFRPPSPPARS